MNWTADGPMCGFDTETTSPEPTECRLVSATTVNTWPHAGAVALELLVQVTDDIPAEATAVHGITTEHARANGKALSEVLHLVTVQLNDAWRYRTPIVGMNLSFDFTVIDCETRRAGLPPFAVAGPVIDVYVIDKAVDKYRRGSRKLTDMAAFYGVELTDAHNATADAVAAVEIARAMARRAALAVSDPDQVAALYADRRFPHELVRGWQRLAGMPLAELFLKQAQWYGQQAWSFAEYLRKQAGEADTRAAYLDDGPERDAAVVEAGELRVRANGVSMDWPLRVG